MHSTEQYNDILPKETSVLMNHCSCSHCCVTGATSRSQYDHVGLMSAPDAAPQAHYVSPWEQAVVERCLAFAPRQLEGCHPA